MYKCNKISGGDMQMSKGKKVILGTLGIIIVLYGVIINLVAPKYIEAVLPSIENLSQNYINGKINIQGIKISSGLTITAEDISVADKKCRHVSAPQMWIAGCAPGWHHSLPGPNHTYAATDTL